jgi:hypothetical protein
MKRTLVAFVAMSMSTAVLADTPVSETDAQKIEQETEGTGVYEVDDAKCKDGQYDIKLDKDFKIISITRD